MTRKPGPARRAGGTLARALVGGVACHSKAVDRETVPPASTIADTSTHTTDTTNRATDPADLATDTTTLAGLRANVQSLIGDAACSSVDECRLVAFGSKPCGGPRQYLAYSIAITDSTALATAVARYNAREAEANRQNDRISDCSMVVRPTVTVVDGHCKIAQ